MRFLTALVLSAAAVLSACASAGGPPPVAALMDESGPRVTVLRDGDMWTADYVLDRDALVWAFQRSALQRRDRTPWRPRQWSVETPGVRLERQGAYDILRTEDGTPVPRRLRLRLQPGSADLEADYDPALIFSDGAVALYTEQFNLIPLRSVADAAALPQDLNGLDLPGYVPTRATWRDAAGPVLHRGRRYDQATTQGADAYILFGRAAVAEGEVVATVIDQGLPRWIGDEIGSFAPKALDYYARRLGPLPGGRPLVMVSWDGPTAGRTSMGGSVVPGLVVMTFEGSGVLDPTAEMLSVSRWFIGHEGAHFWLGQAVRYEYARDMWITEGGADLMAVRALKALDPSYDDRAELQSEVNDCARLSQGRSVISAAGRGEHRAYYACGAVFALAAEGVQRASNGGDWLDFLRPLLEQPDGVLSRDEWLNELTRLSRDPTLANDISTLLDQGVADPSAVIARLFQRTGVAFRLENGRVILT